MSAARLEILAFWGEKPDETLFELVQIVVLPVLHMVATDGSPLAPSMTYTVGGPEQKSNCELRYKIQKEWRETFATT